MAARPTVSVEEVSAEATFELRARVLREGAPDGDVRFASDGDPAALHLALCDDHRRPLAVVSAVPAPTDRRPGRRAWRLRGMAVLPALQGWGMGTELLEAMIGRLREAGAEVVWADGRDSALGFYRRRGWSVEGDGYVTEIGVPHHTIVLDLVALPERPTSREGGR